MQTGYVTKRSLKQVERDFQENGFTSVDTFINKNFSTEPDTFINPIPPYQSEFEKIPKSKNLDFLNDTGSGRISKGVKSLEAICKILKGIPSGAFVLFDQTIYSNPYEILQLNENDSRNVIFSNLGVIPFIELAKRVSIIPINEINNMADVMIRDIKSGTFTYERYLNEALRKCKAVVRTAMNYKGK